MTHYMGVVLAHGTADSPTGTILCTDPAGPKNHNCITSFDHASEVEIVYSTRNTSAPSIQDYIAVTTAGHGSSGEYIGVIRNYPGYGNGGLRCFSNGTAICTAPANSSDIPEGVPYQIPALPEVDLATLEAASNPTSGTNPLPAWMSPRVPIANAMITTPNGTNGNWWSFGAQGMTYPGCAQSVENNGNAYPQQTRIVYVAGIPFGGTIGTKDAIVIDNWSIGPPNHIERYFYVKRLGRVAESVSWQDAAGNYDTGITGLNHSYEVPVTAAFAQYIIPWGTDECPQGGAVVIATIP